MSDILRCEPPEELRGRDGWHWVTLFGHTEPAPEKWLAGIQMWFRLGATYAAPSIAAAAGYRYIAPVATPAEVDRLHKRVNFLERRDANFVEVNATLRAEVARLRDALEDMASGWHYIRTVHGDLPGVGWDRCEQSARAALSQPEDKE